MAAVMKLAKLQQVSLHWHADGNPEGKVVVFANSLGTDLRLWDAVLPLLPQGLRYIRFDKRGHGLSSCPDGPYSMDQLRDDTEQLLGELGVQQCLFVGLSIGGMIGQALAAKRPDLVTALVLSNTAAKMGEQSAWEDRIAAIEAGGIACLGDAVMERWFAPAFRASAELPVWQNMLERTPQAGYIGCCQAIAGTDLSEQTAALKLPVMGIAGSDDGASPPALVQATVDSVAHSQFHVIDGTGHLPCVEDPAAYAALLTNFMKENGYV